jgi:hypothetical protein
MIIQYICLQKVSSLKWQLSALLLLIASFSAVAQDKKIEKEDRISEEKMPDQAILLFNAEKPEDARRLRFYFETDGEKTSYEAKFKHNGYDYSAEFGNDGNLEDIEVELKEKEMPEKTLQKITNYIEQENNRHKIEKIQAQYLPKKSPSEVFRKALDPKKNEPANYELIVAVKNTGKLERFEMLFDHSGNFVQKREIVRNEYDYLLF